MQRVDIIIPRATAEHIVNILRRQVPQGAKQHAPLVAAAYKQFTATLKSSAGPDFTINVHRKNAQQLAVYLAEFFRDPADWPAVMAWHTEANREEKPDTAWVREWMDSMGHIDTGECTCEICSDQYMRKV